jgi:hypothetical protein
MLSWLKIVPKRGTDRALIARIRRWAAEALERRGTLAAPPRLYITIWKSSEELAAFYQQEKEELKVVTGEEADFLATHEAWRGFPRIHVCEEKVKEVSPAVLRGVLHHEIGHALHHGSPEFYTFRFSSSLQEAGNACGLELSLLQQCVYFLSVAVKDYEVVKWLAGAGLGDSQAALAEYMIEDTEQEREVWEMVRAQNAPRKIVLASFLKTVLPIEALISAGTENAQELHDKWGKAYSWLSERERLGLIRFARLSFESEGKTFQERLEEITLGLITDRSL